ncbi:MAG: hypothetical protein J0M17_10000 [Planctomycetes bacterium]|nr:hypothetical protein [Planctomycetota bacterium]
MADNLEYVSILYTNYRGETALRRVHPKRIWFGGTDWHPEPQWLLDATDVERNVERTFAMKDIRAWMLDANVSK